MSVAVLLRSHGTLLNLVYFWTCSSVPAFADLLNGTCAARNNCRSQLHTTRADDFVTSTCAVSVASDPLRRSGHDTLKTENAMQVAQQLVPLSLLLPRPWQLNCCRVVRQRTARCMCFTKQRSPLLCLGQRFNQYCRSQLQSAAKSPDARRQDNYPGRWSDAKVDRSLRRSTRQANVKAIAHWGSGRRSLQVWQYRAALSTRCFVCSFSSQSASGAVWFSLAQPLISQPYVNIS